MEEQGFLIGEGSLPVGAVGGLLWLVLGGHPHAPPPLQHHRLPLVPAPWGPKRRARPATSRWASVTSDHRAPSQAGGTELSLLACAALRWVSVGGL